MNKTKIASVLPLMLLFLVGIALAQTDPGVQSASRGTGATIINPGNDPNGFTAFFQDGLIRFQEVETVSNSANVGLGPRFNSNSCSSCHAQPAVGGTGAATNPQFSFVNNGVAPGNTTPTFITANGPTREARFPFFFNPNGSVTPTPPMAEWRIFSQLRAVPMLERAPAPPTYLSPASPPQFRRTTLSTAFPRRPSARV